MHQYLNFLRKNRRNTWLEGPLDNILSSSSSYNYSRCGLHLSQQNNPYQGMVSHTVL